jgi:hypothetical protein
MPDAIETTDQACARLRRLEKLSNTGRWLQRQSPVTRPSHRFKWLWSVVILVVIMLLISCSEASTSSGCGTASACVIDDVIHIDNTDYATIDTSWGLPKGTYERAVRNHEQCHIDTKHLCKRDEESVNNQIY